MPLEVRIAVKMFNLDSCSTFANMTTPLVEIGENLLIGRDIAGFRQEPPTVGQDQLIERLVVINQKENQHVGIEINMKLNSIFTELPTIVKISNKMEGSSASAD